MASNVGSVATITGNPQNMIIGAISQIPYTLFARTLAPVAAAGLLLVILLLAALWWPELRGSSHLTVKPATTRLHKPQMAKALLVMLGVVAAFFVGVPPRRRGVACDPRHQRPQGLSGNRRIAAADVRRPLRRGRGSGEDVTHTSRS
jgi:Na+/H+ antiporter NhaD/arsenite permease-like protein